MKLKLRQGFYSEKHPLDPDCEPFPSIGVDPQARENQHIFDLIKAGDQRNCDYWGFTSWRMFEKTGLTYKDIEREINNNPGSDAYLYYHMGESQNLLHNKIYPIGRIINRLYKIGAIPFKNPEMNWINVFCNFWVAKPEVVALYVNQILKPVLNAFKTDPYIMAVEAEEKFPHRAELVSIAPFVCEYLFGLFLLHNPQVKYQRICFNELTTIDNNIRDENGMVLAENTLAAIFKKYAEPHKGTGGGDKGTLHHYIPTYSRIFNDLRNEKINVLEIGVWKGESMMMWREYFPNATISGIDIDMRKVPNGKIDGVKLLIGDATSKKDIARLFKGQKFDIIIDDGSHKTQHIIRSLHYLWSYLNDGGLYVVEDIQEPEEDIPTIQLAFKKASSVIDTRKQSGRYDDILMIWKK